ncbi:MAG: type II toxin-antitoxin system VapC family toxin [Actinomycetota bacterium]
MIVDTSALIDSLTGPKRSAKAMRSFIAAGERLLIPSLVLYEWLRGPRTEEELIAQDALLPAGGALAFGNEEAAVAARLYRDVPRSRGREIDLAIAAHAVVREDTLWTLNLGDFSDIPGLLLASTSSP